MSDRPAPQVFLHHNPWSKTLADGVVLQYLLTAASNAEEQIRAWIENQDAEPDAVYAQVYLDPTNPLDQPTIKERIFAVVLFGDPAEALTCLPNAAAKADATDRHMVPNGELVELSNFCLGNDDFAWGDSAEYCGAISAGSGLEVYQDRLLAEESVESVMGSVHAERTRWLNERRQDGGQAWFNEDNVPGPQYLNLLDLGSGEWITPSLG
jgi:hypothetical protein